MEIPLVNAALRVDRAWRVWRMQMSCNGWMQVFGAERKRAAGWLRASRRPTKVSALEWVKPDRHGPLHGSAEAGAYIIFNENDLQYQREDCRHRECGSGDGAQCATQKKAPHLHAGPCRASRGLRGAQCVPLTRSSPACRPEPPSRRPACTGTRWRRPACSTGQRSRAARPGRARRR